MNRLVFTAALGATCLALAACGDQADNATETATPAGEAAEGGETKEGTQTVAATWPRGARIVEEDGVTFRVDPDGTRVRLTDTDSRIVVENGVRFRTNPDGTRVRIDDQGLDIDVDLPDVDVGINEKGNPDVDVGDRDKDGGR